MKTATTRILLVDDFQPFRIVVTSLLGGNGYALHEASEGLAAVAKAQELQPDLILLDIHLPKLNGFEVAHSLRELVPSSKIVLLTLENSAEMLQEALNLGAWGYVTKRRAKADLLPALTAVLQGRRFIVYIREGYSNLDHRRNSIQCIRKICPPISVRRPPTTGDTKLDQKYQKQQEDLARKQDQQRQNSSSEIGSINNRQNRTATQAKARTADAASRHFS